MASEVKRSWLYLSVAVPQQGPPLLALLAPGDTPESTAAPRCFCLCYCPQLAASGGLSVHVALLCPAERIQLLSRQAQYKFKIQNENLNGHDPGTNLKA